MWFDDASKTKNPVTSTAALLPPFTATVSAPPVDSVNNNCAFVGNVAPNDTPNALITSAVVRWIWVADWTATPAIVDSAPAMVAVKSIFNGCARLVSDNVVSEAAAVHAHNAARIAVVAVFFIFSPF